MNTTSKIFINLSSLLFTALHMPIVSLITAFSLGESYFWRGYRLLRASQLSLQIILHVCTVHLGCLIHALVIFGYNDEVFMWNLITYLFQIMKEFRYL